MPDKIFFITSKDNHQMPMYAWLPNQEPAAILFIVHGMAEYAERYSTIVGGLIKNNIAVFANDNRGHGKAVTDINTLGIVENNWFNNQVEDILLAINFLKEAYPKKKIFLLGHSMGSFLCQRFHQLYGSSIDGLILSASNGKQDPLMSAGIAIAFVQMHLFGKKYRSRLLNTLSFGKFNNAFKPNRTLFDWLSRDTEEVDKYVEDPLCGFVCSASFFYYFFKGLKDIFDKQHIQNIPPNVPVYLFAGDKDPVGLFGKGFMKLYDVWKANGVKDISYKLYDDGRHEMLNETNREEVIADLVNWITLRLKTNM